MDKGNIFRAGLGPLVYLDGRNKHSVIVFLFSDLSNQWVYEGKVNQQYHAGDLKQVVV